MRPPMKRSFQKVSALVGQKKNFFFPLRGTGSSFEFLLSNPDNGIYNSDSKDFFPLEVLVQLRRPDNGYNSELRDFFFPLGGTGSASNFAGRPDNGI